MDGLELSKASKQAHSRKWITKRFIVPSIPDPSDVLLRAYSGGKVRQEAFSASEQLLRMIASFGPDSLRTAVRFTYEPNEPNFQDRLQIEVLLRAPQEAASTIEKLSSAGPLTGIYTLEPTTGPPKIPDALEACSEVVRREEAWKPDPIRKKRNEYIPEEYFSVHPFEPSKKNDWLAIDRLLDRFDQAACVEVLVTPTSVENERLWIYRYITQLIKVNRYNPSSSNGSFRSSGASDFVRSPIADQVRRQQEDLHRKMATPHLHFAIRCWAAEQDSAHLLASTVAESATTEGKYRILSHNKADIPKVRKASRSLEILDRELLAPGIWGKFLQSDISNNPRNELVRMSRLASIEELSSFYRLPVGRPSATPRTMRRRTDPVQAGSNESTLLLGHDAELGSVSGVSYPDRIDELMEGTWSGHPPMFLPLANVLKHVFVAGVPGSGKTTSIFNILAQLARHNIPFLVIEPAKTEYRTFTLLNNHPDPAVRELAQTIQVYSVGDESLSPLRFNPLAVPDGITLDEHIGGLFSCFQAAFPLEGPMEGLLAASLDDVYENWTPERNGNRPFPNLADLVRTAKENVDRRDYSAEVKGNLRGALEVRLELLTRRGLGQVLDCDQNAPPLEELFGSNVILEMDALASDRASLVTLFFLTALREHIRVSRSSTKQLQHVTIIEEAHNIVGRSTNKGGGGAAGADPSAKAAEYVTRMLAEVRALGEGLIIADQLPSAVAPEVVKNTGTKMAHRLVAEDDREELGRSMLMDDIAINELARLGPGECYLYSEGMYKPRQMKSLNADAYLAAGYDSSGLPSSPTKPELIHRIKPLKWFQRVKNERQLQPIRRLDEQANRLEAYLNEAERLLNEEVRHAEEKLVSSSGYTIPRTLFEQLSSTAREIDMLKETVSNHCDPYLRQEHMMEKYEDEVFAKANRIRARFKEKLLPQASVFTRRLREEHNWLLSMDQE